MSDQRVDQTVDAALDLLQDLIGRARRAGADAADAVTFEGISLSHARRLGKTEKLERSEGHDLGLRVFIGRQQEIVSPNPTLPLEPRAKTGNRGECSEHLEARQLDRQRIHHALDQKVAKADSGKAPLAV